MLVFYLIFYPSLENLTTNVAIKERRKIYVSFFYSDPVMVSKTKGADKDDLLTVEDGRDGENTRSMVL